MKEVKVSGGDVYGCAGIAGVLMRLGDGSRGNTLITTQTDEFNYCGMSPNEAWQRFQYFSRRNIPILSRDPSFQKTTKKKTGKWLVFEKHHG